MPAIIIERYQSGRFATNEAANDAYQKALSFQNQGAFSPGNGAQTHGVPANSGTVGGLTQAQVQAVGQALAARSQGSNVAVSQGSGVGTREGPLHVVVDESLGGIVFRWFKFILWFSFFTYISLVIVSFLIEGLNLFKRPGSKPDSEVRAENQTTRFSDVHGATEAKDELQELVEFLRNPGKFSTLGGKLPKGVLLVGPPGTGKTLLARAVAGEAGVPFFYMSGSEFDEVYVGVGAKRVRELFTAAKGKSPSIIFIDELDAIGRARGQYAIGGSSEQEQTLNQILSEMDGFSSREGIIVLAATNQPDVLDPALLRPGRFDRRVVVNLPDKTGREAILKVHTRRVPLASDVRTRQ